MGSEKNRVERTTTAVAAPAPSSRVLEVAKAAASNPIVRQVAMYAIGVGLGAACKAATSPALLVGCEAAAHVFHFVKGLL